MLEHKQWKWKRHKEESERIVNKRGTEREIERDRDRERQR